MILILTYVNAEGLPSLDRPGWLDSCERDMQVTYFDEIDATQIAAMDDGDLDCLPFGLLELDDRGVVVRMNRTEREIVGHPASHVEGRDFFTDVAPCTNTPAFLGRFRDGVASGHLRATFEYRYDGQRRASVWIHMFSHDGRYFVLSKRIGCS